MVRGERRTSGKTTAKAARPRKRSSKRAEAEASAAGEATPETSEPGLPLSVTPEERQRMIEAAAYARAERRGFSSGDPMDDWLAAESEVDARLLSESRKSRRREPSA